MFLFYIDESGEIAYNSVQSILYLIALGIMQMTGKLLIIKLMN